MTRPTLAPALSGLLGAWLPRQRWFPVKTAEFTFEPAGGLRLETGAEGAPGAAAFEVLLLRCPTPPQTAAGPTSSRCRSASGRNPCRGQSVR